MHGTSLVYTSVISYVSLYYEVQSLMVEGYALVSSIEIEDLFGISKYTISLFEKIKISGIQMLLLIIIFMGKFIKISDL